MRGYPNAAGISDAAWAALTDRRFGDGPGMFCDPDNPNWTPNTSLLRPTIPGRIPSAWLEVRARQTWCSFQGTRLVVEAVTPRGLPVYTAEGRDLAALTALVRKRIVEGPEAVEVPRG